MNYIKIKLLIFKKETRVHGTFPDKGCKYPSKKDISVKGRDSLCSRKGLILSCFVNANTASYRPLWLLAHRTHCCWWGFWLQKEAVLKLQRRNVPSLHYFSLPFPCNLFKKEEERYA